MFGVKIYMSQAAACDGNFYQISSIEPSAKCFIDLDAGTLCPFDYNQINEDTIYCLLCYQIHAFLHVFNQDFALPTRTRA